MPHAQTKRSPLTSFQKRQQDPSTESRTFAHILLLFSIVALNQLKRANLSIRSDDNHHSRTSASRFELFVLLLCLYIVRHSDILDMTTRLLLAPSRNSKDQQRSQQAASSSSLSHFRLQPPPIHRREKRKGRIFQERQRSASSSDTFGSLAAPSCSPSSCSPQPSSTFVRTQLEQFAFTTASSSPAKRQGVLCLSPKQVMQNDIRLVYPTIPGEEYEHATDRHIEHHTVDGDSEDDNTRTVQHSTQTTPRAASFSFHHSSLSQEQQKQQSSNQSSEGSPSSVKTSSTTASTNSNETTGTFGNLRRRSSARNAHGNGGGTAQLPLTSTADSPNISTQYGCIPHVIVCLSPMSPLSPNRRAQLHTPRGDAQQQFDTNLLQSSSTRTSMTDREPLSATLKRIGAARTSQHFVTKTADDGDGEDDEDENVKCGWHGRMKEKMNNHVVARSTLVQGAEAAKQAETLLIPSGSKRIHKSTCVTEDDDDKTNDAVGSTIHQQSRISYVPGLGILGLLPQAPRQQNRRSIVQSTVRAAPRRRLLASEHECSAASGLLPATCCDNDTSPVQIAIPTTMTNTPSAMKRISNSLVSYIFGNYQRPRAIHTDVFLPTLQEQPAEPGTVLALAQHSRGDGWGGLRPRTSWFPNLRLGPLISPNNVREKDAAASMRRWKDGEDDKRHNDKDEDDDNTSWIDEPDSARTAHANVLPYSRTTEEATREADDKGILKTLRVRFPSQMPEPRKDRERVALNAQSGSVQEQGHTPTSSGGCQVTYTDTSAEGRPVVLHVGKRENLPRARRILASVILISVAGALACVLVLLATGHVGHHDAAVE